MAAGSSIPSVLIPSSGSSISTERALKQVLRLLEDLHTRLGSEESSTEDAVMASIDDVGTLLSAIDRTGS